MTELQNLYEAILEVKFDRRNFYNKMLKLGILSEAEPRPANATNVIGLRVALSAIWSPVVRTPAAVVSQEDTLYIG